MVAVTPGAAAVLTEVSVVAVVPPRTAITGAEVPIAPAEPGAVATPFIPGEPALLAATGGPSPVTAESPDVSATTGETAAVTVVPACGRPVPTVLPPELPVIPPETPIPSVAALAEAALCPVVPVIAPEPGPSVPLLTLIRPAVVAPEATAFAVRPAT